MQRFGHRSAVHTLVGLVVLIQLLVAAGPAGAASHREAPLIALDPTADITDVYFFRSWESPDRVVLVMNVIPQQAPTSGPNFFNLDDQVRYAFHLDTNANRAAGLRGAVPGRRPARRSHLGDELRPARRGLATPGAGRHHPRLADVVADLVSPLVHRRTHRREPPHRHRDRASGPAPGRFAGPRRGAGGPPGAQPVGRRRASRALRTHGRDPVRTGPARRRVRDRGLLRGHVRARRGGPQGRVAHRRPLQRHGRLDLVDPGAARRPEARLPPTRPTTTTDRQPGEPWRQDSGTRTAVTMAPGAVLAAGRRTTSMVLHRSSTSPTVLDLGVDRRGAQVLDRQGVPWAHRSRGRCRSPGLGPGSGRRSP